MEVTLKHNGSIAHHHGIGKHRTQYMGDELGNGILLLYGLKRAFDPKGIMNPGTLIKEDLR